jgi:hypothetical protein
MMLSLLLATHMGVAACLLLECCYLIYIRLCNFTSMTTEHMQSGPNQDRNDH